MEWTDRVFMFVKLYNINMITQKYVDQLTYQVIGCAIEVHKYLGPGLIESVYERCFLHELTLMGLHWKAQRFVPINYKGLEADADLRYDVLVEDVLIVELKAVEAIAPIHEAKLLTYMRLLEKPKGVIINFNCVNIFKEGQKTVVNNFYWALPKD